VEPLPEIVVIKKREEPSTTLRNVDERPQHKNITHIIFKK